MVFFKLSFTELPKIKSRSARTLKFTMMMIMMTITQTHKVAAGHKTEKKSKGQMVYIGDQMKYFTLLEQSKTKMNESMAQQ